MQFKRTLLIAAVALTASAGLAGVASATPWEKHHPRQDQVLDRAVRQRHDVRSEFKEGDLTRAQEHHLLARDTRVIHEDRFFAHSNGGYITRGEQRFMNRQENRVHYHLPK